MESNVIRFPPRASAPGTVNCNEAGVTFPQLYRFTVESQREHWRAMGFDTAAQEPPFGGAWVGTERFYAFDPKGRRCREEIGDVTSAPVSALVETDDVPNLLIKHHRSREEAFAFLDGHQTGFWFSTGYGRNGIDLEKHESQWTQVGDDYFTLTSIDAVLGQTKPRLLYQCYYSTGERWDDEVWIRMVLPDGQLVEPWANL